MSTKRTTQQFLMALMVLLAFAPVIWAEDRNWTGGSEENDNISNADNWDVLPNFATDSAVFNVNTGLEPVFTEGRVFTNVTFGADAGAFLFDGPADRINHRMTLGTTSPSQTGFLTNNSANLQTFNMRINHRWGSINAVNGDFRFNGEIDIGSGNAGTNRSVTFDVSANRSIFMSDLDGDGLAGFVGSGTDTSNGGVVTKEGAGTLFVSAGNDSWNGRVVIANGPMQISHTNALGAGGSGGKTTINGAASTGSLQLTGGISTNERINIISRDTGNNVPHIENVSGSNTLSGLIETSDSGGNGVYAISTGAAAAGKLLTISGSIQQQLNAAGGNRALHLRGAGDGLISSTGAIIDHASDPNRYWSQVIKSDSGTWTFAGTNTYKGLTRVQDGTLIFNGTHTTGGAYTVDFGALLGGTGNIGSDVDLFGTIAPGDADVGTLSIGGLTLQDDAAFVFELQNTFGLHSAGVGNDLLAISGALTAGASPPELSVIIEALGGGDLNQEGSWVLATYGSLNALSIPTFNVSGIDQTNFNYSIDIVPDSLVTPLGAGSIVLSLVPVPEPNSIVITAMGIATAGAFVRRRAKR